MQVRGEAKRDALIDRERKQQRDSKIRLMDKICVLSLNS